METMLIWQRLIVHSVLKIVNTSLSTDTAYSTAVQR